MLNHQFTLPTNQMLTIIRLKLEINENKTLAALFHFMTITVVFSEQLQQMIEADPPSN